MVTTQKKPLFNALHFRGYRLYWFASLSVYGARWMQTVVVGWLVLELTNSAFLVGLVGACQWGPMLLGAFTGLIADRLNRRVVLIWLQFSSALACFMLGFLIAAGLVQTWQIMILSLFLGIAWAIDWPCRRAIIPDLVGEGNVLNGIALDHTAGTAMLTIGSVAGGQFITAIGMGNSYYLIGAVYLAATFSFFLIGKTGQVSVAEDTNITANVAEGMKYIFQNQAMLAILAITVIMNAFIIPYRQLLPIFARDILEVGAVGLGYLSAAHGLGALLGSITLASLGSVRYRGGAFLGGSFGSAILLLVFAFSTIYPLSLVSLVATGFAMSFFGTLQSTILLNLSAEQMRGRVMGILSLAIGVMSLGMLVFGAIAETVSAPLVVGISAVIAAVSILAIPFFMPTLRKLR